MAPHALSASPWPTERIFAGLVRRTRLPWLPLAHPAGMEGDLSLSVRLSGGVWCEHGTSSPPSEQMFRGVRPRPRARALWRAVTL